MLEKTILQTLIFNEQYCRKVIPFFKSDYFSNPGERKAFILIAKYIEKYNKLPTKNALLIDLDGLVGDNDLSETLYNETKDVILSFTEEKVDVDWLTDRSEKFCQDAALYNAVKDSISIMDDKSGKKSRGQIPKLLQDALGVCFDSHLGHNYVKDAEKRYDILREHKRHVPFDIEVLNEITAGGVVPKTLNCFIAPTGVGKTLLMCHFAAVNLLAGQNVLYFTMEMAEEEISNRIDANLLDIPLDMLKDIPKDAFLKKIKSTTEKLNSQLVVKEYPTAGATSAHFRYFINEIKLKQNFIPDIIYVDYLNICASARLRFSGDSYNYIKSVVEEIRGLAVEFNVPIITATQTNREGAKNSDFSITEISDSFGTAMTLDLLVAVITSDELASANRFQFKQLKNRYTDVNKNRRFYVGVNKSKMKLINVDKSENKDIIDVPEGIPVFDKSKFEMFK